MRYTEAFREGYDLMKRNWQLVAIKLAAAIINIILFLLIVVLPLVVVIIMLGADLSSLIEISNMQFSTFLDQFVRYFFVIMMGIILFLVYLLIATIIAIYVFGASSGVIANSIKNRSATFTSGLFFSEGKRLFGAFFRYITVISIVIIPVILGVAVIIAAAVLIVNALKTTHETVSMFIGIFFALSITSILLFIITVSLAIFLYGAAYIIFAKEKSFASIKKAALYLYNRPSAYWLYCLLLLCSLGITLALTVIGIPLNLIPIVGPLFSIPYQIFVAIIQTFVGFFVTSVVFIYFYRTEMISADTATATIHISSEPAPPQPSAPLT